MQKAYKISSIIFLVFILMSNTRLIEYFDNVTSDLYVIRLKGLLYSMTKINWNYAFFTSHKYGYMSYEIVLSSSENKLDTLRISNDGKGISMMSKWNYIRSTSLFPSILASDSAYIEASCRSIALFYFQNYNFRYNQAEITVYNNEFAVTSKSGKFNETVQSSLIYNRRFYY